MHCLHPSLFVAGIWLFSWGIASAQAPTIDAAAARQGRDAVARECQAVLEPRVSDEVSVSSEPVVERLRTLGSVLAAIVTQAIDRSTTFRQLVEAIGQTDGIVYVEHGRCGHGVHACLLAVTSGGANRIVRVRVAANKADWELMGSVGHELQHAVEVLGNPAITSTAAMHVFYSRIGHRVGNVFETAAAVRAGNKVRAEVRSRPHNAHSLAGYRAVSPRRASRADRCRRTNDGSVASASTEPDVAHMGSQTRTTN
jgi:hypothetical protein